MPRKPKQNNTNIVNEISSFVSKANGEQSYPVGDDDELSDDEINIYLSSIKENKRVHSTPIGEQTATVQQEPPTPKPKKVYKKKVVSGAIRDVVPSLISSASGSVAKPEPQRMLDSDEKHFKLFEQYRSELDNLKTEITFLKSTPDQTSRVAPPTGTVVKSDTDMRRELLKLRFN